jgi:hypothetical protein
MVAHVQVRISWYKPPTVKPLNPFSNRNAIQVAVRLGIFEAFHLEYVLWDPFYLFRFPLVPGPVLTL